MHNLGSTHSVTVFKNQIAKHIEEFDRIQLALLRSALKANNIENHEHLIKSIDDKINEINDVELDQEETAEIDELVKRIVKEKLEQIKNEREGKNQSKIKLGIKDFKLETKSKPQPPIEPEESPQPNIDEGKILQEKFKVFIKGASSNPLKSTAEPEPEKPKPTPIKSTMLKDYLKTRKYD